MYAGTPAPVLAMASSLTFPIQYKAALSEIEYKAFPADIVEKVEIDLTQYNVGDMIHVKDLPLAANSKISLVTPEDTLIVNIAEPEAVPEDEDEEAAEE